MVTATTTLELRFSGCDYGLSARRLWEHTELGQINVFGRAISQQPGANMAAAFIDVVRFDGETFSLLDMTLAELQAGQFQRNSSFRLNTELSHRMKTQRGQAFVRAVAAHLQQCATRQAVRNLQHAFLPVARAGDSFGVPYIFSTLQRRLKEMGHSKAAGVQWMRTIENFQKKGLRAEEMEFADLIPDLNVADDANLQLTGAALARLCHFNVLRISVIPVISDAHRQLQFAKPTGRKLTRTKNLSKALAALPRTVSSFEPALGYRIEEVEHESLWGAEKSWQAVTFGGKVISTPVGQTGFQTAEAAAGLANQHAKEHFPKRMALGRFGQYAWTGGQDYREWLITLPYYPVTYLSGHFKIRNVLAHVRCDVREGANSERVLMLQEVQSDWAQRARKASSTGTMDADDEVPPPFMKEWPALVMKLVLLHAAHQGLDAVAWTRGAHQVHRWNGLGAAGLIELYDRTLPREVNRMMKPFDGACEAMGVFVPTNFCITQSEAGYEVYSMYGVLLGIAPTLEDARAFVPDMGKEMLFDVHGVRLTAAVRKAILGSGFPAWG